MYSGAVHVEAARLRACGLSLSQVSRELGVHRSTLRAWEANPQIGARPSGCGICESTPIPEAPYAALLGYYLGDGCISRNARYFTLRVTCDLAYPDIIEDVETLVRRVRPGRA